MIMRFLLSVCILWCPISFASPVTQALAKLNEETLTTEFWALNCVMMAQKSKVISSDCDRADKAVHSIDKQLLALIDKLTVDSAEEPAGFYTSMRQIKQFRTRLQKINHNLSIAKKVSGVHNWSNKS